MAAASFSSEKFKAVNVESTLKHCSKERFLKNKLLLAALDGRHCRSRSQKLAESGQPGMDEPCSLIG